MNLQRALKIIEQHGFLLVFPIKNHSIPNSLWHELHPNTPMSWEWDETGDGKLFHLWRLRESLASSKQVIYGKYYQGRATFFSKNVFRDLLTIKLATNTEFKNNDAKLILELLEMDSPLSTKQIKEMAELKGKFFEPAYHKALRILWNRLEIVAIGEIDDGAFPSLAHGATRTVFEDLWQEAQTADLTEAWMRLCDLTDFEVLEQALLKEPSDEKNIIIKKGHKT
jgi:hypothetical protein